MNPFSIIFPDHSFSSASQDSSALNSRDNPFMMLNFFIASSLAIVMFPQPSHTLGSGGFLGPAYSVPQNLLTDPTIKAANEKFLNLLTTAIETGSSTHGDFDNSSTAFSFDFYSSSDEEPIFQYHYTPPILAEAEYGVKTVDRNTIYRIGSITKLLTVYTFLLTDGDVHFNTPITKWIPELLAGPVKRTKDPVHEIAWEEVTIGALASHMAGIGSTYGWLDISLADFPISELGLPELSSDEKPTCGATFTSAPCPENEFLKGFAARSPTFPTFQTPVYSNSAFQIFAIVLSRIAGQDFKTLMNENMIKALNLTRTSNVKPDDTLGVIPGNITTTSWNYELGGVWPTGGVWSSTADLSTIGRSILSSKLLPPSVTRRWMKPLTHTSSPFFSVGSPWEIYRAVLPISGRVVDLYTKDGKLGAYSGYMILVPDFDVGFTLLQAGPGTNTDVLAGSTVDVFLPALEEAARQQSLTTYIGEYKANLAKSPDGLNSSFTLTSQQDNPGLILTNWINNGSALIPIVPILRSLAISEIDTASAYLEAYKAGIPLIDPSTVTVNLFPTGLKTLLPDECELIAFRAVFDIISEAENEDEGKNPFADLLTAWSLADVFVYGSQGLDEFVFKLDKQGRVVGVENPFLRGFFEKI
ncbi:hypothetical protein VTL71DRAFT_3748 [Oculimacula yallundae]|uniref:Beta-lactamase-related domain-containing protein n=1 Tax=Oculimacula yallundae TaxID=86028 RepID=A0ABR4C532_9HELO